MVGLYMKRAAIFSLLAVGLASCSHSLYLVGRNTGAVGTAEVVGGKSGGDITITLAGKPYNGRWVYMSSGGSMGISTINAYSGGQIATATGTTYNLPTGGNGSILAAAADGSQIRCVFNYSEWSETGTGLCQDNRGEFYDLQIN